MKTEDLSEDNCSRLSNNLSDYDESEIESEPCISYIEVVCGILRKCKSKA
nr:13630_t:CDS:2 [Entrophospora candida]